jgi:predicted nucleic acid-binding Zn ribbon protein
MPSPQPTGPRRLGDFIKFFLKKNGLDTTVKVLGVGKAWSEAVGDARLLAHTRPGTVRSGILKVVVDAPVVLQELNFRRRELAKKVAELAPTSGVRDLRFVIGSIG